jgi:NTP pyrophosphatase (non-canonical NTP hydrolase)
MTNIVEHTIEELVLLIEQWAEDRNIINGTKPLDQAMKLFSEFGELADNVGKGRDCRDDIGDVFVVLTIIFAQLGESISDIAVQGYTTYSDKKAVLHLAESLADFSDMASNNIIDDSIVDILGYLQYIAEDYMDSALEECVQIAYNDIKDRVGVVYNGVYIKSTDIAYEGALKALGKL